MPARLLGCWIAAAVAFAAPPAAALGVATRIERPAVPAPPVWEARLSTSAIKTLLRQKGYTKIGKVRMSGAVYRVRARDPWGRRVEFVIDSGSARILRKIYPK